MTGKNSDKIIIDSSDEDHELFASATDAARVAEARLERGRST